MSDLNIRLAGRQIPGAQFNPDVSYAVPFTQQMLTYEQASLLQGDAVTQLEPIDAQNVRMRTFDTDPFSQLFGQLYSPNNPPDRPYTQQKMTNAEAAMYAGQKNVEITPLDDLYSEVKIFSDDPYAEVDGQQYSVGDPSSIPFTQQLMEKADAEAYIGMEHTEVTPQDDRTARVRVFDNNPFAELSGQDFAADDGPIQFAQQLVTNEAAGALLGNPSVQVEPKDDRHALVRTYNFDPLAQLEGQVYSRVTAPVEFTQQIMSVGDAVSYLSITNAEITPKNELYSEVRVYDTDLYSPKSGQLFNPRDPFVVPFQERIIDNSDVGDYLGQANTEIIPDNDKTSTVKVFDTSGLSEFITTYYISYPGVTSFNLPDTLVSVSSTYSLSESNGQHIADAGFAESDGERGGISISASASAQASLAIAFDVSPEIKQTYAQNVPSQHYFFYMMSGALSQSDLLAQLGIHAGATILPWPKFLPVAHTLTLKGGQASISAQALTKVDTRFSTTDVSWSYSPAGGRDDGHSQEVGISLRSVRIPPTIHGSISISPNSQAAACIVTVKADTPAITATGSAPSVGAISNEPTPVTATYTASITPTSLSATTPSAIPTTGFYLKDVTTEISDYDLVAFHCEVVDFSYFA